MNCQQCNRKIRKAGICGACYAIRREQESRERAQATGKICVHCRDLYVSRPRRLCQRCFSNEDIRNKYRAVTKAGQKSLSLREPRFPALEPTLAIAGTDEKIAVMAARAAAGQQIFHPDDAVRDDREATTAGVGGLVDVEEEWDRGF